MAKWLLPGVCAALAAAISCGDGYSRAEVRYNLGRELAADGDAEAAIAEFSEALRLDPGLTLAYHARGVAFLSIGDYRRAAGDLTAAIALDPGLAEAYRYRITADMVTGNIERAFRDSYLLAALRAGGDLLVNAPRQS